MASRIVRFVVVVGLIGLWLIAALPAAADGIPTPMPGVTSGPDGGTLRQIAQSHNLACQADAGGVNESVCVRSNAGVLSLSATFFDKPSLVMVAFANGPAPMAPEGTAFLSEMSAPFCAGGAEAVRAFVARADTEVLPLAGVVYTDATCRLQLGENETDGSAFRAVTAFALGGGAVPSAAPVATSQPAAPTPAPAGGPTTTGGTPGSFARSIPSPAAISLDPTILLQTLAVVGFALLLIPFPAQLFNSTLDEHYDEVRDWFPKLPSALGSAGRFWQTLPGIAAFVAIAALLYALLDPGLGLNAESAGEWLGMAIGIVVTTLAFAVPAMLIHRRRGHGATLEVLPGTLLVGVVCVVVSRLTGFQPGYLYGVLLGVAFAGELARADAGREAVLAALVMLVASVAAWLVLGTLSPDDSSVAGIAIHTALGAIVVGGLEGVVFGMAPLRFLPGEKLWAWSRAIWAVVFGIGMFAFAHILINPESGYLGDTSRTPFFTVVALIVGFAAVSIGFWGYFRFRGERPPAATRDVPVA